MAKKIKPNFSEQKEKPSFHQAPSRVQTVVHREPTVMFWGETQVGKTSLFATAFCGEEGEKLASAFSTFDREKNFHNLARLNALFQVLKAGQKIEATGDERPHNFELAFSDRKNIVFQDIKGSLVGEWNHNDIIKKEVEEADVLLCVIQWKSPFLIRELNAIYSILPYCKNKIGLIFTKAEKGLAHDDPAWNAELGWWRSLDWLQDKSGLLEHFEERIWPVSCYGFQEDGTPSLSLGEFGQLIPYNIKPKNVLAPIIWSIQLIKES